MIGSSLLFCNIAVAEVCGAFFEYGDLNGDGTITLKELQYQMNMAWYGEWFLITKKMPPEIQEKLSKGGNITRTEFDEMATPNGKCLS